MGLGVEGGGGTERTPWDSGAAEGRAVALAALWASGPDTALDGVFRMQALRCRPDASPSSFDRFCAPVDARADAPATARMVREFGVTSKDLAGAAAATDVWSALRHFLGDACVVVASSEAFTPWAQHLRADGELPLVVVGLDELGRLLLPSRAAHRARGDVRSAHDVWRALGALVGDFAALDDGAQRMAAAAWTVCWSKLRESDSDAAARLAQALALVERPSAWSGGAGELFGLHPALRDGVLSQHLVCDPEDAAEFVRDEIEAARPRWAVIGAAWRAFETIPVSIDEPAPLGDADLALVDDVFQVHLPTSFSDASGAPSYRQGQHAVAREVARTLGQRKLLLVHAPTGTGKTLSYLVPALLWSLRNELRVCVSTYTRALQEQALEQEVPRALAALRHAGVTTEPRITVLKGRSNYVCWRALRIHVPGDADSAEAWLAWTSLALFAAIDDHGDLDRFTLRPALAVAARAPYQRELDLLVRSVRAQTGCCSARHDRETCAADVVRQRAERSHLLITNHAFAVLLPSYFKHVIFDECEHLHDVAGNAWSWSVTLREIGEFLVRLRQPGRPQSRAVLDRLERVIVEGDGAHEHLQACLAAWAGARGALDGLQAAVDGFKRWRDAERGRREPRDEHSLMREFVSSLDPALAGGAEPEVLAGAQALVRAHEALVGAANALDAGLSQLAALLDAIPARGMPRLRRALELARGDLSEWLEALDQWIPRAEGRPTFADERFYDVERDGRGDDVLVARVLLPNEILGRHFYPQLESAVLISATTWLRNGFGASIGYLGLDRARQPLESEERAPSLVETFRAEAPFDYSRVLVCVPNDAPDLTRSRDAFQQYVRRFIAHLGERTRGRMLVLFTNADETRRTGEELSGFFRARGIPLWFQNMPGVRKEELGELFRARVDSILLGVDTFWYGADFPGETLEYLVIVKLPYGVPDRYHHAQCAALGASEQRRRIYLPRALGKLRQGFGRLMRRESDRGCVFVLDVRVLSGSNKLFLGELPLDSDLGRSPDAEWARAGSRLVVDTSERCFHAALAHMDMLADVERRGLVAPFGVNTDAEPFVREPPPRSARAPSDSAPGDVPF